MPHNTAKKARARRRVARAMKKQRRAQGRLIWLIAALVVVAIVATMVLTSRPGSSDMARTAPDFTLTDTAGVTHRLSQHRGGNVLLYFSEGAGCQSCLVQIGAIEKVGDRFADRDITVLPIVMNTKDQIARDMQLNGVTTPFLLDDGTVSSEYGTLGKGMHAGLPGHSFVLIDASGQQRWYGEYPSMWLSPADLLAEVDSRLGG